MFGELGGVPGFSTRLSVALLGGDEVFKIEEGTTTLGDTT